MKLNINDIREITLGASRVTCENGKVRFHRFTEEEELFYKERDAKYGRSFSQRCSAPAGIKLSFTTDSRNIKISATVLPATSRSYFSYDSWENGKLLGYIDNFKENDLPENYTETELKMGTYSKAFNLSDGESAVSIYFPWSVFVDNFEIELDDCAFHKPVKPEKKLLVYGDSITQGYDALRPSNRYAARLAEYLLAEEINKAIGGEIFVPDLVKTKLDFEPDYISVAYGSNDWSTTDGKNFAQDARMFYKTLSENYPNAEIFALTPIWRADFENFKPFGKFFEVEQRIREATSDLKNVTVISGFDLVSHDKALFADLRLHPKDEGFDEHFKNLSKRIGEIVKCR